MNDTVKVRITAKEENKRRFAVMFMGVKVAVAFDRDSGAQVGNEARMLSGDIGSGGSRKNWHCFVAQDSVFELEVDKEFFEKNRNRIKKWDIEVIDDFSISSERSKMLENAESNLE